jgi:peptidoglycan hydrolase-like protein with peptidoglycan-binding domain
MLVGVGLALFSSISLGAQAQDNGPLAPDSPYRYDLLDPIWANGRGVTNGVGTGIFNATLKDKNSKLVARYSVCNDLAQHIAPPYTYTTSEVRFFAAATATANTAPAMANRRKVAFLIDFYLKPSIASTKKSATFQQVVWNLWNGRQIYTGSGTQYDASWYNTLMNVVNGVGAGNVDRSNYISNTAIWVRNSSYQDQLMTLIPEPAFYQMSALLTLGGVGLLRMRRKRK